MTIATQIRVAEQLAVDCKHGSRKHLQKLVRKVQLVLVIKRCIDELKDGGAAEQRQVRSSKTSYCEDFTEDHGFCGEPVLVNLPELPTNLKDACKRSSAWSKQFATLGEALKPSLSTQSLIQFLDIANWSNGLLGLEALLDQYVADCSRFVQETKKRVVNATRDAWISWAKRRRASCRDQRSQTLLMKLLDDGTELHILEAYLDAYKAFGLDHHRVRLGEVLKQIRGVFNVGWFFEWPSGRHPLNSTWPWADVKPSLLVLWGVCWMFFPTSYLQPPRPSQNIEHRPQRQAFTAQGTWNQCNSWMSPTSAATTAQAVFYEPMISSDMAWLPGYYPSSATIQRQPQSRGPEQPMVLSPYSYHSDSSGYMSPIGHCNTGSVLRDALSNPSHSVTLNQSLRVSQPGSVWPSTHLSNTHANQNLDTEILLGIGISNNRDESSVNLYNCYSSFELADFANHPPEPSQTFQPQDATSSSQAQYTTTSTLHNHSSTSLQPELMPSISMTMPSPVPFSYPPLDNIGGLNDGRPYMAQERDYPQIHDTQDYEQHHDQHDQPRYPTPPPPLSENPYNPQQLGDGNPDGRLDIVVEHKEDSDAPSPGRSKPVPKPDREVTKDPNGRFYCNWPNCTEEIRDFGRKCEWSKHMDKHDRPYKCLAEGCEKLPGFTYSGGLLRHEREVHNKHGGPRRQLNCPHQNCKRHTGKGFSRQENLNEHLRRVHTETGLIQNEEDTEDEGSEVQPGGKRKRAARSDSTDLREEMKRLKQENEELRRQAESQTQQQQEMMRQIIQLQQAQQLQGGMHPRMAPPAQMT